MDSHISSNGPRIDGYFFQGWESVGGDDFIEGRTLPILGDQWKTTGYGQYELKSEDGVAQKLYFRETLKKAEDGTLRRETPPCGL